MSRKHTDAPFAAPSNKPSPDSVLPPAFSAAARLLPGNGGGLQAGKGASSRPDQLNKARKPSGGPNRTAAPRKGHR